MHLTSRQLRHRPGGQPGEIRRARRVRVVRPSTLRSSWVTHASAEIGTAVRVSIVLAVVQLVAVVAMTAPPASCVSTFRGLPRSAQLPPAPSSGKWKVCRSRAKT